MNYHRRSVFLAACFGILLFGITLIILGSIASDLREKFQMDEMTSGTLFSILPIGILSGSLVFGPIVDRYGYRILLALSALTIFGGLQGIAYANSFDMVKVFTFLFGMGGGAINGATNAVVADISTDNKAADLSLLGVSFTVGALGMPFIMGLLRDYFSFETIVSAIGFLGLIAAAVFSILRFPPPKQPQAISLAKGMGLFKDGPLLLITFFLFCQSSMEGLANNWTTFYLIGGFNISPSLALYGLSLYVLGMGVMRVLIGSALRSLSSPLILYLSFLILIMGNSFLNFGTGILGLATGLVLLGAGLAAGYPVMLGFVSDRYEQLSGTAFGFVLSLALFGNMSLNYLMGIIAERYGITYWPKVSFVIISIMLVLSRPILKKTRQAERIRS